MDQTGDGNHEPVATRFFWPQFRAALKDTRLWIIVLPALLLVGVTVSFAGPRVGAVLTFAIGLIASYLLRQMEKLPVPDHFSTLSNLYVNTFLPALAGILVLSSSEILTRLWMMPWYWFHTSKESPSCPYFLTGAVFNWLGFAVCGSVIGALTERRATFAAMTGVAVYLPLTLTDIFTGDLSRQTLSLFVTACHFQDQSPDSLDLQTFRFGLALGFVTRALLAVFAARLASSWRLAQRKYSGNALG